MSFHPWKLTYTKQQDVYIEHCLVKILAVFVCMFVC